MLDRSMQQAEILKWLGPADRIDAQEIIVKRSQRVPGPFPELALKQAAALPEQPGAASLADRLDLRDIPFATIDGADARDFDDAIHVENTGDGFLLRVAIADVSHYVLPDARPGCLDQEARARGNSWYFPRSVEPMLPRALSSGLCSLRPGADRLAMLVEMPFAPNGEPLEPRFAPIVMRSRARLVYGDVAAFFNGDSAAVADAEIRAMLAQARVLYKILAGRRRLRGSLDFQIPEPAYEFDAGGRLAAMRIAVRTDASQLIEEFMIAANEAVAGYLGSLGKPFLYRSHPAPEPDKLKILYGILKLTAPEALPPALQKNGHLNPCAIQEILARARGTQREYMVSKLCLRSMGQARYQSENTGHFGLASPAYCHFTSPIRRYADILTHRALKAALGLQDADLPDREELARIGDELNDLERRTVECEREMAKRMACLALLGREGEMLKGTVSGVTDFGVFVEFAAMPAEGLMRIGELGPEWFELDQERQMLLGQNSGRIWRLGQPVSCILLSVDLAKQEISLKPYGSPEKLPKENRRQKRARAENVKVLRPAARRGRRKRKK